MFADQAIVERVGSLPGSVTHFLTWAYQRAVGSNYERRLYPRPMSAYEVTYRTYDLLNVSAGDSMLRDLVAAVGEDDTVYDIGANVGNYSFVLAGQHPSIVVQAFEPQPVVFEQLCRNVRINADEFGGRIVPHDVAVSSSDGTAVFHVSADRGSGSLTRANAATFGVVDEIEVETIDLDTAAERYGVPDLIKIDAEGQLIDVLEGGTECFDVHRPTVYFETHHRRSGIDYDERDVRSVFGTHDYVVSDRGGHYAAIPEEQEETVELETTTKTVPSTTVEG